MLEKLQSYFEFNSTPITYKLDDNHIYIIFDESILKEREHHFIENRIAGLDLNPNYIAFIVREFNNDTIIHKNVYDLTKLNETYYNNKKDHEFVEIAKSIANLCKHYKVECVGLEKLTMTPKDHGKGRYLNRLLNSWSHNKFFKNLKKRLNILGIKNQEIVCAYSSTVGCLDHPNETDSVAAALEIARRTYVFLNRYIKKRKEFSDRDVMFPDVDRKLIKERWNSILSEYNPKNIGYKGIHEYLKQQKKLNKLRFLFKDYDFSSWSCFSLKSHKSLVACYQNVSF
jgi:IS605 OrfB family transposase